MAPCIDRGGTTTRPDRLRSDRATGPDFYQRRRVSSTTDARRPHTSRTLTGRFARARAPRTGGRRLGPRAGGSGADVPAQHYRRSRLRVLAPAPRRPQAERHRADNEYHTYEHAAGCVVELRVDDQGTAEGGDGDA